MKKASLQLSINAIVILVMAMVILGLGLTLIQDVLGGGKEKLQDIIDDTRLEHPATADDPLTIDDVELKKAGSVEAIISFFNDADGPVTIELGSENSPGKITCYGSGNNLVTLEISGGKVLVSGGQQKNLKGALYHDSGDTTGLYTCTLEALGSDSSSCSGTVCASTSFFLTLKN